MGLSKTGVIYTFVLFYAVLFVFMGFYGTSITTDISADTVLLQDQVDGSPVIGGFLGISGTEAELGFIPSVIVGFSNVPSWLNLLLFTPIFITLLWVFVTSLFGFIFDGGA